MPLRSKERIGQLLVVKLVLKASFMNQSSPIILETKYLPWSWVSSWINCTVLTKSCQCYQSLYHVDTIWAPTCFHCGQFVQMKCSSHFVMQAVGLFPISTYLMLLGLHMNARGFSYIMRIIVGGRFMRWEFSSCVTRSRSAVLCPLCIRKLCPKLSIIIWWEEEKGAPSLEHSYFPGLLHKRSETNSPKVGSSL